METGKISNRYARAIFEYAAQKGEENILQNELKTLAAHFFDLPELKRVSEDPTVDKSKKINILQAAAGNSISQSCKDMLKLIVNNDRADYVYSIALMYDKIYRKEKKILLTCLSSVKPIDDKTKQALVNLIVKDNEKVEFLTQIDESLIGGFVLSIEDRRLDASVRNQLNEIKKELLQ